MGFMKPDIPNKSPARQAERPDPVTAEDVQVGATEDSATAKGKRALVRPVSSSLGGM